MDAPYSRASTNPSPSAELEAVSPKHPLQSDWTLWYFKNDKSKSWDANLKSVSLLCNSMTLFVEFQFLVYKISIILDFVYR